jgi:hypothetical protein
LYQSKGNCASVLVAKYFYLIVLLISVEALGFSSYPPAYFSSEAQGENLLYGANFASAASGFWDKTSVLYVR